MTFENADLLACLTKVRAVDFCVTQDVAASAIGGVVGVAGDSVGNLVTLASADHKICETGVSFRKIKVIR